MEKYLKRKKIMNLKFYNYDMLELHKITISNSASNTIKILNNNHYVPIERRSDNFNS